MHVAFGAFLPLQGGEYGMEILARYPSVSPERIRLPGGNEPRIASLVEIDASGLGRARV